MILVSKQHSDPKLTFFLKSTINIKIKEVRYSKALLLQVTMLPDHTIKLMHLAGDEVYSAR